MSRIIFDPVALDKACADLCNQAEPVRESELGEQLAKHGEHAPPVLSHLAGARAAAHTNIFDCPAKSRHLMPFKM